MIVAMEYLTGHTSDDFELLSENAFRLRLLAVHRHSPEVHGSILYHHCYISLLAVVIGDAAVMRKAKAAVGVVHRDGSS